MTFFDDYRFAEPKWLWLLTVVPLLLFLGFRPGARSYLSFPTLRVLATLGWATKDRLARFAPLVLPLALIPVILGMARPQEISTRTARTASGIDIVIALDVSESMSAADFFVTEGRVRLSVRRIEAAKKIITEFIEGRPDDRIGIVSFAARPYTVAPITLDHQILKMTLRDTALVRNRSEGGTAIGSALAAAGQRLDQLEREDAETGEELPNDSKIVVLVTDGASNSGQLSPSQAAKLVADLDIKVYTVALGTPQGRIPGMNAGREFDPETLQEISRVTNGDYYRARDYGSLREAFKSIDDLEKTEVEQNTWLVSTELYPWFVGPGAVVILGFLLFSALNPPPMP